MSKLRFRISMSLDGFVAGPSQSVDNPLGIGGMRLHEWAFPLAVWRAPHGIEGGEANASSAVVEESIANIGATVMGRNMFGGHPGPWDGKKAWDGGSAGGAAFQVRPPLTREIVTEARPGLPLPSGGRSKGPWPGRVRRRSGERRNPGSEPQPGPPTQGGHQPSDGGRHHWRTQAF